MNKPLKIVLGLVAALVVILVLAIGAFALFFDPNDFRGKITEEVKKATGRELALGNIKLSIFPTLGARVQDVKLGNAEGFGDTPFAAIGEADVGVRLLPLLLHRDVQVGGITLSGLQLNLAVNADGKNNWDDLASGDKQTPTATPEQPASSGNGIKALNIGGVTIKDAAIKYDDRKAKKAYSLSKLNLKTGAIAPGKPFDFALDFATEASDPALKADISAAAKLAFDLDKQQFTAEKLVLKIKAALTDLTADVELGSTISADLNSKVYKAEKITLKASAEGKSLPGGKQTADFTADAIYDGSKGTVKMAAGELLAAGLTTTIALDGSGLNGDNPRFTGPLSVKPFNPRELLKMLGTTLETADAAALKEMSIKAKFDATTKSARLNDLVIKLDQSTISGNAGVADLAKQAAEFALKLDAIDADRYLPPKPAAATPAAPISAADKAKADAAPLPVDALDTFTANGTVDIGKLKVSGVNMSNVKLKLNAVKGADKRIELAANLYGGSINTTTRITPGAKPTYAETLRIASISAAPLLKDFLGKDYMSGQGGVSMDLTGAGKTMGELKRALNGNVSFEFKDGAVKGFNLGQIIRKADALLTGTQLNESEPPQTDFTELSASAKITNGVLQSDALNAKSPLFRVDGAGKVDLANETLDYTAKPTIVNTISGQGGKDMSQLNGLTIPVHVTGPWSAPKYSLDLKLALQQKATEKLRGRLDDQIQKKLGDSPLKEKLSDTLNSLFGKKKKPEDAPPK